MYAAYEKLIQHLDERDVSYLANGEGRSICADFRCEVGSYRVIAAVDEEGGVFQVFGYAPVRVPEGARPAIAETIARANFGLRVGKFEMDYDQGELRFQAAQILTDDSLEEAVIDRLMGTTMSMLDMYLPAVLSKMRPNVRDFPGKSRAITAATESDVAAAMGEKNLVPARPSSRRRTSERTGRDALWLAARIPHAARGIVEGGLSAAEVGAISRIAAWLGTATESRENPLSFALRFG